MARESDPDETIEPLIRTELAMLREAAAKWRVSSEAREAGKRLPLQPVAFEKVRVGGGGVWTFQVMGVPCV